MSKSFQTTLVGVRQKKERFFAAGCESSPYYCVVESLWATTTVTDRKVFLESAQKEWSLKYKDDPAAQRALLERAAVRMEKDSKEQTMFDPFVRVERESSSQSSSVASTSGAVRASVPSSSSSLVSFLKAMNLKPDDVLTEDVLAKSSLMSLMGGVADLWMQYFFCLSFFFFFFFYFSRWRVQSISLVRKTIDESTDTV